MSELAFFDSNAVIGQPLFDPESGQCTGYRDRNALLSSMDYYGVDCALVSHWRALKGDPMGANNALVRQIAGSQRLFPCFTLLPENLEGKAGRKQLSDLIREGNVRAARIPFGESLLCAASWVLAELFRFLEERAMLAILMFPHLGVAVPERDDPFMGVLDGLLSAFPRLPVVTLARLRGFFPLMERHENLLTSLEWDPYPDFVEEVVRRFGSRRLLFGTPFCENAREVSGMPMMMVAHAEVSAEDKARVAGRNLAQALGLPAPEPSAAGRSRFSGLLRGEAPGLPVLDVHTHVGPWGAERKPAYSAVDLVRVMSRLGPARACITSTEAVTGGDHIRGNEDVENAVRESPASLSGILVYNPDFSDGKSYVREAVTSRGFRGIKLHPRLHRCAVTDPRYATAWEAAEAFGIPVLCHTGEGQAFSEPDQFAEIAQRYPRGRFILAHTGETFAGMQQCIALLNRFENLYVDVSGWLFMKRGMLEYLVRRVDTGKILYGSDYSWIDVRYALAIVLFADIDERTRTRILRDNAAALFPG